MHYPFYDKTLQSGTKISFLLDIELEMNRSECNSSISMMSDLTMKLLTGLRSETV